MGGRDMRTSEQAPACMGLGRRYGGLMAGTFSEDGTQVAADTTVQAAKRAGQRFGCTRHARLLRLATACRRMRGLGLQAPALGLVRPPVRAAAGHAAVADGAAAAAAAQAARGAAAGGGADAGGWGQGGGGGCCCSRCSRHGWRLGRGQSGGHRLIRRGWRLHPRVRPGLGSGCAALGNICIGCQLLSCSTSGQIWNETASGQACLPQCSPEPSVDLQATFSTYGRPAASCCTSLSLLKRCSSSRAESMAWRLAALLRQMSTIAFLHASCKASASPAPLQEMPFTRPGVARATALASTESGWFRTRLLKANEAPRLAALLLLLARRATAAWVPPAAATAAACVLARLASAVAALANTA